MGSGQFSFDPPRPSACRSMSKLMFGLLLSAIVIGGCCMCSAMLFLGI